MEDSTHAQVQKELKNGEQLYAGASTRDSQSQLTERPQFSARKLVTLKMVSVVRLTQFLLMGTYIFPELTVTCDPDRLATLPANFSPSKGVPGVVRAWGCVDQMGLGGLGSAYPRRQSRASAISKEPMAPKFSQFPSEPVGAKRVSKDSYGVLTHNKYIFKEKKV
ncbi:hypothetical protein APTSU1_000232400 [Apodemus speciosus]|uniref:Uncharacterized protein n=1 Tax=Apodemus speciosus TaxID=105296 RepID=A0ABQ0EJ99_APOSI